MNIQFRKVIHTGKAPNTQINRNAHIKKGTGQAFEDVLEQVRRENSHVKFSKHARERINTRNLELSEGDMDKICRALELAEKKGVKDSLVIVGNMALIVNIPSKTIVTAMDGNGSKENVFTNIDGAVII
ncbi:MAG: flagellar biosynthesis protein [Clostridiales bacterium]|nr:flagellar biosynthesis protein [Clostridiales bacterium]